MLKNDSGHAIANLLQNFNRVLLKDLHGLKAFCDYFSDEILAFAHILHLVSDVTVNNFFTLSQYDVALEEVDHFVGSALNDLDLTQ